MKTYFLNASVPLTKTIELLPDGTINKDPYPNVYAVTSYEEDTPDIASLHAAIVRHASLGNCLLKGKLLKPLVNESRAGSTVPDDETHWLCLDIDGLPGTFAASGATIPVTTDLVLKQLGLSDVSHILQWSASQGLDGSTDLRLHIYFMLTHGVSAHAIKQWLIQHNHSSDLLSNAITLSKTGNTLKWALDISACQNDKLLYIAPPTFKNMKSPMGKTPRISLVRRALAAFTFPAHVNSADANKALTDKRLEQLREFCNLPKRKFTCKVFKNIEVLLKPDACTITGIKMDRGFVYFNLNGGDSWAYYHPEDKPDVIYNFKGEPNYLTKELLPDYWGQLTTQATRTSSLGITFLAFLDRKTSTYYRGTYDEANDDLQILSARNETQIRHFAEQVGIALGTYIPEWDLTFDPHDNVRVDIANRTINTFQLTEYMKAKARVVDRCPPTILRIIHHALGSDAECTEHFINWVAFILQNRTRAMTAWILHGTEGTGKGLIMNRILRPIFGKEQTTSRRMEELNEPYNGFMKNKFLVFVDEVQTKALENEKAAMAKLRNFITEPTITIRDMYVAAMEYENRTNWIFNSNESDPVAIPKNDRRFNVGVYQPNKLNMTDAELAPIESELQDFHDYLLSYPVDLKAVATPLDNNDRSTLISISESSIDTVASAILGGDMEFLIDQLPSSNNYNTNVFSLTKVDDYKHVLKALMLRADTQTGECNISRDELRVIFEYLVGKIPESPNKFTSMLKHHRMHTTKVKINSKAINGIKTVFKDFASFATYTADNFQTPAASTKSTGVKS